MARLPRLDKQTRPRRSVHPTTIYPKHYKLKERKCQTFLPTRFLIPVQRGTRRPRGQSTPRPTHRPCSSSRVHRKIRRRACLLPLRNIRNRRCRRTLCHSPRPAHRTVHRPAPSCTRARAGFTPVPCLGARARILARERAIRRQSTRLRVLSLGRLRGLGSEEWAWRSTRWMEWRWIMSGSLDAKGDLDYTLVQWPNGL